MKGIVLCLLALSLALPCRVTGSMPTIANGDFEGPFVSQGDDFVPEHWNLIESTLDPGEISILTGSPDNGPALPGTASLEWTRSDPGAGGDFTGVRQYYDPPIEVSELTGSLILSLDVKAISHNLCASGWFPARGEFPVGLRVHFQDENDVPKTWTYGWYIWTGPPCGPPPDGLVIVGSNGIEGIVYSEQIPEGVWISRTFNLLEQLRTLTEPSRILSIRLGGAGWSFSGRADNLRFFEPPTPVTQSSWGAVKGRYR